MTDARRAEATARSHVFAFLAQAFADPDAATLAWLKLAGPAAEAALSLIGGTHSRAALADVLGEIGGLDANELAAAHRRVFGHGVSGDCPPYEGEYGHPHIFQKCQALADNAGYLQAFGLAATPGFADRLDHISVELEFLHVLAAKEAYALDRAHGEEQLAVVREAMRNYVRDHVGRWAPAFAARLEAKAQDGVYAALARLLAAVIAETTLALQVTPAPAAVTPRESPSENENAGCGGCPMTPAFEPAMRGEP